MSTSKRARTTSYRDWLGAKLSNPERAARYLNAAAEDSEAMFLKALRKVASSQSRSMTEIADACGVSRESLYRMLSETGNPTSENRRAILATLGMKSIVVPIQATRRLIEGAESTKSHNTTAASGILEHNSLTGGRRLKSVFGFGVSTPTTQARKSPMPALENFTSVGHLPEVVQLGGGH